MFSLKKPTRLGQWTGRRRSSRSEEPVLPHLWRRTVLLRLAVVLVTALGATALGYGFGPTHSFRAGQVYGYEIRSRVDFGIVTPAPSDRPRDEAVPALPEGQHDGGDCRADRSAVPPALDHYPAGTLLVPRGQPITESQLLLLHEENQAFLRSRSLVDHVSRAAALFLVLTLLSVLVVLYVVRFQPALAQSLPKIVGVCALVLLTLALALLLSRAPWHAVLIPLTVTALVLTIAYNPQFALLMSLSLSLATIVSLGSRLGDFLVAMGGQATAVLVLRSVRTRTRLVQIGVIAGIAYAAMTVATGLHSHQQLALIAFDTLRGLAWGALAGFLATGLLPVVERLFAVLTDVSLLELADGSHPLLQELVRRAPGTYTHSMTVATLAEPAAEAIGANPLLTRVGSYFHDVGKMLKPHYFIENQTGANRHDDLEPALSTLIIIGHVKDGAALAQQYRLPRPIVDFIEQHHGTTLVEYFYRQALKSQEETGQAPALPDGGPNPLEASFRYPGPKPRTREAGIVMLADAVESSSRVQSNPTPGSLRKLVHDLSMKRLLDGQFEESGLTLTELKLIEESLSVGLIALFHSRIRYPAAEERKAA
jgi:putative nucleotidyltransferase with HDIG domain